MAKYTEIQVSTQMENVCFRCVFDLQGLLSVYKNPTMLKG